MNYNITLKDIFAVYFRSFLYQNLLNDKYFQNFGFLYTLYPVIKKFKHSKEAIKVFLLKNFEYFNTNPYLVSFIQGVAIKLIQENEPHQLKKIKFDMMSPIAAIGDAISWGIVRSFFLLVSAIFVFFNHYAGILIFVIAYNLILNVFFRFFGLIIGYKNGMNVIFKIANMELQHKIAMFKKIGLIIWGSAMFLLIKYKYKLIDFSSEELLKNGLIVLLMVIIAVLLIKLNKITIPFVVYIIYIIIIVLINI